MAERTYDEGVAAGEIAQRLREHDQHFAAINGSVGDVADKLGQLTLQMQRMADAMTANEATVIKTAAALKEAKEASERRWSPATRLSVIIGSLAAVASVIAYLITNSKP